MDKPKWGRRETGVALAGTLAALGVLAIVGTWPRLMRPDEGGQIVQGGRSFLAAMVLVLLFELVLSPTWPAWQWLAANVRTEADVRGAGPWIVAAAWVWGVVVAAVGVAIGARNFRRLSTAR